MENKIQQNFVYKISHGVYNPGKGKNLSLKKLSD